MLKKILCINLSLILFVIYLCGCNNENTNSKIEKNETSSINSEQNISIPKDIINIDYSHAFTGLCYLTGYDNMIYSCGQEGFEDNYMIYVADLDTGIQVPLCNKVNCKHNNEKCNAFLCTYSDSIVGMKVLDEGIYVIIKSLQEGEIYLERISFDGSTREDLGYILKYKGDNVSILWVSGYTVQFDDVYAYVMFNIKENKTVDRVDENGEIIEGISDVVLEDKLRIYRYKLDGTEEAEIILDEDISESVAYVSQYNILDGYLYYNSDRESKRINLDTLCIEAITQDMYYVSRYNNEGKILACDLRGEEIDYYVYDDKKKTRYSFLESGLEEADIELLKKASINTLKYYIDNKYVYIYEPMQIEGTLIFDHEFKYIGITEEKVIATIGDNLMCTKSGSLVSIKRDDIFESKLNICTLIEEKSNLTYEWPTYLAN